MAIDSPSQYLGEITNIMSDEADIEVTMAAEDQIFPYFEKANST